MGHSTLLSSHLVHGGQLAAQLLAFLLGPDMCAHTLLSKLEHLLVHRDLEQLHGAALAGAKPHLSDHVPYELDVLGQEPMALGVPQLAHILGHLWPLLRPMAMG